MLAFLTLGMVSTAGAVIGAVVIWAHRNDTLRESDQEQVDRRFADIMRAEGYLR